MSTVYVRHTVHLHQRAQGKRCGRFKAIAGRGETIRDAARFVPMTKQVSVLVVDHDNLARCQAASLLQNAGYRIIEARDALEALTLLSKQRGIAVLFTEAFLPGLLDGIELARLVYERFPDVRLLITLEGPAVDAKQFPSDCLFVTKPCPARDVLDTIGTLLLQKRVT